MRLTNLDVVGGRFLVVAGEKPRGGGFSVVKKALNMTTGEPVAIKFVTGAADDILRKVFEREESLLRRSKHPNIIRFIDSGLDGDTPYIVLAWAERNISALLDTDEPPLWEPFIKGILSPVADALAYLHGEAIEHRDIKPINVLADDQGTPLLADFGIAKLQQGSIDTSLTLANLGSRLWAPPEYATAAPFVRDVFALGVLLIYGMTPKTNRPSEFYHLQPALEELDLPSELRELIGASVNVSPEARPKNAIEFVRRLNRAVEAQIPVAARFQVGFGLTRAARNQIVGENGFPDRAESILLKDLAGESFASFRWDSETGKFDSSVIFLVGATLMLTLKFDDSVAGLLVTGARRPDYDVLERSRNGALRTDMLVSWAVAQNASSSSVAVEALIGQLTLHHAASSDLGGVLDDAGSELLSKWRRSLDARESIETDRIGVLEFENSKPRGGKETEFTLLEEQEEDLVGSEWQILDHAGRPEMRGYVVQQSGTSLFVRWQWGQGNVSSKRRQLHPYLGPSQSALSRQRDALRQIESGSTFNPDLLELVSSPANAQPPSPVDNVDWVSDLDESKQAAVRAAVGLKDCMVVAGPPGTGKTRFIAETVAQTLLRKPSAKILIVSQTHVAIDNALERLVRTGVNNIVRIGRRDDDRVADSSRSLLLDEQLELWAQATRTKAETYFDERAMAAGISRGDLRAVMHLEEFISIQRNRIYLQSRLLSSEASPTATRLDMVDDSIELRKKVDDARKREEQALTAARTLLDGAFEVPESPSAEAAGQIVAKLIAKSEQSAELLDLLRLQADWLQRISSDDRLAAIFLSSSQVIAGTCLGFIGHKAVRDLTFDLCIIDEASKATSTEALVPLVRSSKFVLVGDENQLPPLDEALLRDAETLAANNLTAEFVKETLFMRLSRDLPPANRFMLTDQYRMISPIGNLISDCFYEGTLRSPLREGVQGYASFGREVLWLDTSSAQGRRENFDPRSSGSYMNRYEAKVAIERLETIDSMIDLGLIPKQADGTKYSLLLIAPYRSQLDELARQLSRVRPNHLIVEVESVDAVQGREADFAIFSVTRSNSERKLGFLGADYWRRINVALSRARYGLTIVGDADFSSSQPGGLKRVLTHIRANKMECEVRRADVPE